LTPIRLLIESHLRRSDVTR